MCLKWLKLKWVRTPNAPSVPFEERIQHVMVGQRSAVAAVGAAIARMESGWHNEDRPLVMLFLGSSGVGKTEMAKCVAEYLHPSNGKGFIRLDMSEYQEKNEVSKMIGAPPGYVGHEDGGQLTKALRECPKAVVLLDEVEKAHNDVLTVLLQLFDEGRLTDGKGETIECKNAVFIMTSNLAADQIAAYGQTSGDDNEDSVEVSTQFKQEIIRPILKAHFKRDEFLGRINQMVYFLQFSRHELNQLVVRELQKWSDSALKNHNMKLSWDEEVVAFTAGQYDVHYGARSITNFIENSIIDEIVFALKSGRIARGAGVHITITTVSDGIEEIEIVPVTTVIIDYD